MLLFGYTFCRVLARAWGITFLVDRGSTKSHYLTKIKIILSRIKNSKQNYLLFLTNKLTVSKENLPCPWFLERDVKWALEVKTWKRSSRCSWATSLFQQGGHFAVTFGGRKNLHWIKLTSLKDLGKGLCEKENCILLLTNFTWGEVKLTDVCKVQWGGKPSLPIQPNRIVLVVAAASGLPEAAMPTTRAIRLGQRGRLELPPNLTLQTFVYFASLHPL
jgi:hypothetical protein